MNLKPPAPLKPGLCFFLFCLLFCPAGLNSHHPIGEKTSDRAYFFLEEATLKARTVLKHSKGVLQNESGKWYFRYIFRFFQNIFWKNSFCEIHLVNIYRSFNFLGEFSDPENFLFKKSMRRRKISPTKKVQIGQSDRPKPLWYAGYYNNKKIEKNLIFIQKKNAMLRDFSKL